ncbi:uncharacterized protein MISP3 isoform X2 [Zootoca vivipara]|uniref:uncharacterized protein MISP3 isoform X2 n=1 Tax=Zootoca vivipara TaxID=8524 RepID=UPI00293C0C92|nr:uncharacterized protein MISP3 isoform X2 [Zootoca vivipara]
MSTETLPLPPPAAGLCLREQENSGVDVFGDMVESGTMAGNVPIATPPDDSLAPSLDVAAGSLAKDNALQEPSTSGQEGKHVERGPPSPVKPPEGTEMAEASKSPGQGQDDGYSAKQDKTASPSPQLNSEDAASLLAQGGQGSQSVCCDKMPGAPCPTGTLERLAQEEEASLNHCLEKNGAGPTDSLKQLGHGQEEKGTPLLYCVETSGVSSEQQKFASTSNQLDVWEESGIVGSHSQDPASEPLEEPELVCCRGDSQVDCAASSQTPSISLPGTNSPKQSWEGDCLVFPNHHPSSALCAEHQETFDTASVDRDIKPGCSETVEAGKEESTPRELDDQSQAAEEYPGNLNWQLFGEGSVDHSQTTEKQDAQDAERTPAGLSLALVDAQPDAGTYCQQRAAGADGDTPLQAAPKQSPGATGDSSGPAHWGLAPDCGRQEREGLAAEESSGTGNDSQAQGEAGAKAALESEKGEEEAPSRAGPGEATCVPESAKDLAGAKDPAGESPGSESPTGTRNPAGPQDQAGTMVLASAEDPLGARDRAGSQDLAGTACPVAVSEHATSSLKPGDQSLLGARDPASTEDLVSPADPVCATSTPSRPPGTGGMDWTGNATEHTEALPAAPETPIEREIRLHQEREEHLRRQRGLASPWGTQEYVEVRIRPILNQNLGPPMLPKEKERQWAGVQMQREIQRECQREEDLVQLGKVRGAYDRGTPQEMQEKLMIFEQHPSPEPPAPRKMLCSSPRGARGLSFAEANSTANMVIVDSGALLRAQRPLPERTPASANPFFCLRAKSPQSLLEQEVQEAQERERELQRQRHNLYGSALPCQAAEASAQDEEIPSQPERPSCKKLDVTWPPPSPPETSQPERSPRILRRQRSALIQRWESGAVGNQDSED